MHSISSLSLVTEKWHPRGSVGDSSFPTMVKGVVPFMGMRENVSAMTLLGPLIYCNVGPYSLTYDIHRRRLCDESPRVRIFLWSVWMLITAPSSMDQNSFKVITMERSSLSIVE